MTTNQKWLAFGLAVAIGVLLFHIAVSLRIIADLPETRPLVQVTLNQES